MANTKIYTELGVFPNGVATFDVTNATEVAAGRTPTGCVVLCSSAVALDTPTTHLLLSYGGTDFTDVSSISVSDEHAATTQTDATRKHTETNIIEILDPGLTTVDRSATVAAITGGVRFTASSGSTLYRVQVILIFGTVCKAFSSDGDGSLAADETFTIAHGMTTGPGAGFYWFNRRDLSGSSDMRWSLGFHSYDDAVITQACAAWTSENAETVSMATSRTFGDGTNNRVCVGSGITGGVSVSLEVTAIDTTNVTYTNRDGTNTDKYCGLLLECEDVLTEVQIIDSHTNPASDWNFNGLTFQSQFVALLPNRTTVVNTTKSDSNAGAGSFAAMDAEGREHSTAWSTQDGITLGTTNTSSELAQALFCPTQLGGNTHLMVDPTLTTDGWDFANADITAADGTIRKWPMLAIGVQAAASGNPWNYYAQQQ